MDKRIAAGAARYAAANKSDPFAYNRAMSHASNGVSGYRFNEAGREDAFYDAMPQKEERMLPSGEKYEVPAFNNVKVP